jgi:hypothetical protein
MKSKHYGGVRLLVVLALIAGTMVVTSGLAQATTGGTFNWQGNGFPNPSCTTNPQTMLWIFNDNGSAVPSDLFINGVQQTNLLTGDTSWQQQGGGSYHFMTAVDSNNFPPTQTGTYADYTGTVGNSTVLTLSGCNEGGVQTASLTILKSIPNVLQDSETVTFTFQAILSGVVKGSCQITFTAGETNDQCTITGLQPNTQYTIHEVPQAPWATQPDQTVTTGDPGSNTAQVTFENTFGPATARACKVTDVDNTGHDASSDTFTFELFANGASIDTDPNTDGVQKDTVTVNGAGTAESPNCASFATSLVEGVKYTIAEQTPATGWTLVSTVCDVNGTTVSDFTPDYPDDADAVFTCTATNSITAAHVTVRKVTIPAGSEAGFTFHLFADGVEVATATSTGTGALNFTPNVDLQDGVHYTITEDPKANWSSNGGVGCDFTVSYPADSGKTFTCVFTNTHVSNGLTMGYWKTHLSFDSKHPNAPYTAKYLPQSLGNYVVNTTTKATAVWNAANCSNSGTIKQQNQNAIGCLAGQLLAAELNVANGADTCANGVIADANAFLISISYIGPTGNYSGITAAQRATAISLKTALDTYNNGTCPV